MNGGRVIHYDIAITSAAISSCLSLVAFIYIQRNKRGLDSSLLDSDARGWQFGRADERRLCASLISRKRLRVQAQRG
jgi:predicted Co/Zn/Cd cation transporter (cation efflux family)